MEVVQWVLERLGLTVNNKKTRIVKAREEGFTFLGFELQVKKNKRTGHYYPHVQPSKKSLKKIKDRITVLTERKRTPVPWPVVIGNVNEALIGWVGYFHYKNCSRVMLQLKGHVEQRIRTHLCKRHKVKSRGTGYLRFPNRLLYEKYGLYKVPTTAGWDKADA
jgi:RNA-directed DNA polymerase